MNWKETNLKAVLLIANKQVKKEMDSVNFGTMYIVGDEDGKYYNVRVKTVGGFNKVTCTCKNASLCAEALCVHKISVVMFTQRGLFQ